MFRYLWLACQYYSIIELAYSLSIIVMILLPSCQCTHVCVCLCIRGYCAVHYVDIVRKFKLCLTYRYTRAAGRWFKFDTF